MKAFLLRRRVFFTTIVDNRRQSLVLTRHTRFLHGEAYYSSLSDIVVRFCIVVSFHIALSLDFTLGGKYKDYFDPLLMDKKQKPPLPPMRLEAHRRRKWMVGGWPEHATMHCANLFEGDYNSRSPSNSSCQGRPCLLSSSMKGSGSNSSTFHTPGFFHRPSINMRAPMQAGTPVV